jgi:hypothetical protein
VQHVDRLALARTVGTRDQQDHREIALAQVLLQVQQTRTQIRDHFLE